MIGYLVDLGKEDLRSVEREVRDIRYSKIDEDLRCAERAEFAKLIEGMKEFGLEPVGLKRGRGETRNASYLSAIWPRGRTPHLLLLSAGRLVSVCRRASPFVLPSWDRLEISKGWAVCRACREQKESRGMYQPLRCRNALTVTDLLRSEA